MSAGLRRDRELYARPVRQLCLFVLAVMLLTQIALATYAWSLSEDHFMPALERKAQVVGKALADKLARAIANGVPLESIGGVKQYYDELLRDNPDVAYLILANPNGAVLQRSGKGGEVMAPSSYLGIRTDVVVRHVVHGYVQVGVERRFMASRIRELRADIAIIIFTSLLVTFEILWFAVTLNFSAPLRQLVKLMSAIASGDFRQRVIDAPPGSLAAALNATVVRINQSFRDIARLAKRSVETDMADGVMGRLRANFQFADDAALSLRLQRVISVRLLTFLFMFAEMLSRPFLPLYAGTMGDYGLNLPEALRSSVPLSAFLLGLALAAPLAGRWSDLVGRRRSYITGALMTVGGLLCAGMIYDFGALVLARAIGGVGYALMFMACQGFVNDHTEPRNRAKGMALFFGAIMMAEVCAPAVGGILADRVGQRAVFLVGALVALIAALLALRVLQEPEARPARRLYDAPAHALGLDALGSNVKLLALSFLSGAPARFMYTGVLVFLVPVLLAGMGSSKSEIGRYTMIYGLAVLILGPLCARLAERFNAHAMMVGLGALITGYGLVPVVYHPNPDMVLLGIGAIALGQAMSIPAQLALVLRATAPALDTAGPNPGLGAFRLIESLGAAAGPLAAGVLVAKYGAPRAMMAFGMMSVATSLLFAMVFLALRKPALEADDAPAAGLA